MKINEIKKKILIDTITNTVTTEIENSLKERGQNDVLVNKISMKVLKIIYEIIESEEIVIEDIQFDSEEEFEEYILEKSNELREILLNRLE